MRALVPWMVAAGYAVAQTGDVVTLEVIDGSTVSYRLPAPKESDAARIARLRAMKMFAAPLSAPKPLPMTTVGEWMDRDLRNDPRTLVNRDGWLTDDDVDFLAKNRPAAGVPVPAPFAPAPPTPRTTAATAAAERSTFSPAPARVRVLTLTPAGIAGTSGITRTSSQDCTSYG